MKTANTASAEPASDRNELRRWRWLFFPLGALAVAAAFYFLPDGGNSIEAPSDRPDSLKQPKVQDASLSSIPGTSEKLFDQAMADVLVHLDPSMSGWQTEVLTNAALDKLGSVAQLIGSDQPIKPAAVTDLLAESFVASPLRPQNFTEVFSDANLSVRRGATMAKKPVTTKEAAEQQSHDTAAEFVSALETLRLPLRAAEEIHVKFKIFRVEQSDRSLLTRAFYQASGRLPRGGVQQNAVWVCRWGVSADSKEVRLAGIEVRDYEEITPGPSGGVRFIDCTESALGGTQSFREQLTRGIDYWRPRLEANYGVDPNGNQGLAIGDVNGDGLDDLYVCQQGGLPNRLYLQNADGTLRDASKAAGVDWMEVTRSALLVDLDNDGDQDLAIARGWYWMIMLNDGQGTFTVARMQRSSANLYSTTAADYDNDGDLDLFFCGRNPGRELGNPEGLLGTPIPYHDANNGGPNILLENDGRGNFTDVTSHVGLDVNNRRYSYAASWEDYDNDGDLDLYVANDFGRNNLYRNDDGRFVDVAAETGVEDISAGMSVTWGDYDGDGRMDVYVSNMFSSAGNRIAYQRRFREQASDNTLGHFRRHARGNSLFRNSDNKSFDDVSAAAGVTMGRWAWGSKFVDLNNDGHEDLYVTNGFITTSDSGDL